MRVSNRTIVLGALAALMALAAFGACREAPEEKPGAAERRGAVAYSRAAEGARALQAAFLVAWKASREAESTDALREAGRDRVLPALDRYLEALTALPVQEGTRLAALHGPLVAAWRLFRGRIGTYYARVTPDSLVRRGSRLQGAWTELGARIVAYRGQLRELYDALGLRLPDDGADPDGAEPE